MIRPSRGKHFIQVYLQWYSIFIIQTHFLYPAGRQQVSVGVVPIMGATGKGLTGVQSAMTAFPITVANCAEKR